MRYAAPGGQRWTARRKQELIEAIGTGQVAKEEALHEHGLSEDEFAEWLRRYGAGDPRARRRLRATDMSGRARPPATA